MIKLLRIEHKEQLSGAERFGDCANCGTNEDVFKITFYNNESTQQHSFRLCKECASLLADELNIIMKS